MKLSRIAVIRCITVLIISVTLIAFFLMTKRGLSEIQVDLPNFGKAWNEYIANPTSENAQKVYAMLPNSKETVVRLQVEVRPLILESMSVVERQIFSGDRDALKVAFRLFVIADAGLEKELARIMGNLVRFNARLFLEELKNHQALLPDLSVVLCNFQAALEKDSEAQELEKKSRIKALEYIEDEELKEIKKECIKALKKCKSS